MLGHLAWVFAVLSLFGFGGGNAIIPQMHTESVEHFHWVSSAEFAQDFALGRLAPGPTTTMSALIGYKVDGLAGAVVATLAMFVPAAILTAVVALSWWRLGAHPARALISAGIAPVVIGLIWAAAWTLAGGALAGWVTIAIAVVVLALTLRSKINASLIILAAGVLGALLL